MPRELLKDGVSSRPQNKLESPESFFYGAPDVIKGLNQQEGEGIIPGKILSSTPTLILPHSQEHWEHSRSINIIEDENNWLEDAVPMDIYKSKSKRLRGLINSIFPEVESVIPIHSRKRYRDVLKMVIINLWHGHYRGRPVMYSRDRAYYSRKSRFGKLFIKYDRLMPVIYALETLGYIEQKKGFRDHHKDLGRITRMWSTFKLWRQFRIYNLNQYGFYSVARPEKVIVLRDGEGHNKGMPFAVKPFIRRLWNDVERYNEFVEQHEITVNLDGAVEVSTDFLANTLHKGLLKHTIAVDSLELSTRVGIPNRIHSIHRPVIQQYSSNLLLTSITTNQYTVPYHTVVSTMTQRFLPDSLVFLGFRDLDKSLEMLASYLADLALSISLDPKKERRKKRLVEKYPLKEIGIERLVLLLVYEYIHRVFNRKSFDLGGRGYGAIHQRIPKQLRHYIYINGRPTVELDYSAYHIRMLYHQKGIDYRDDPYVICEGPEMRDTYKAVGLIAINGDGCKPGEVIYAIRDELTKRGIPIPFRKNPIKGLIKRFKEKHPKIVDCLYDDRGVELMNIDSRIMNNILMKLIDRGILGLSVYDSIVVAEQHQDFLNQLMMDEYEKEMGFKPIVDVKKKP